MPIPTINLHFKVLVEPALSKEVMLAAAQQVFDLAGITLNLVSTETLSLPELEDLEVDECKKSSLTPEQILLHQNRNGAGPSEVVVYFVRSTVPPMNGCAAHPVGSPGLAIASHAPLWTLGHELGHVLGLKHVPSSDRLMTEFGTANITNPPPDLVASEVQRLLASPCVIQV